MPNESVGVVQKLWNYCNIGQTICDPACGTGGFFIAAYDSLIQQQLDRDQSDFLRFHTFEGWEIVDSAARLCAMNLYLHGIEGRKRVNPDTKKEFQESPINVADSLGSDPGTRFDLVLTNPPFGKKSSITIQHFTLKTNPLQLADLQDFISCYNPGNRHCREETERFKVFDYDTLIKRDKVSPDIFWLKDDSLEDLENLPRPEVIAQEIAENLQAAFSQFDGIYAELEESE